MRRIPAFAQSDVFWDFLREDKIVRDKTREHDQEDAGYYLMKLLEEKRWAKKLWNRDCGIRFTDCRKKNSEENERWKCKRGMEKEPLIIVSTDGTKPLSQCVKESLITKTSEITIVKRIQHPAPRYLVLNFTDKVGKSTPLRYFQSVEFSSIVSYEAIGYVVHLGSEYGHYVYITNAGEILNDLTTEVKVIPPDAIQFEKLASPTLILYRRVTKRRNSSMGRLSSKTAKKTFSRPIITKRSRTT